jgi:hypothetical protein
VLLNSVAGGAHYSGVELVNEHRHSVRVSAHLQTLYEGGASLHRRSSVLPPEPNPFHLSVLDDIKDVRDSLASRDLLRPVFFLMVVCSMRAQVSPKMLEAPEQTTTGEQRA